MKSIFHKLVTKEDDFTQLLFNLIERSDDFRSAVLGLLLPDMCDSKITGKQIRNQGGLSEDGRPDIEVSTSDLRALIEVKVDPGCGLTGNQEVEPDSAGEIKGYLHALSKEKERDRWLVYLVPRHWDCLPKLEQAVSAQACALRERGIGVQIKHWEDVLNIASRGNPETREPLVEEFRKLLAERFAPLTFSTAEVHMLFSAQFVDAWQSIRKLQMLIDRIKSKSKHLGYKRQKSSMTKEEYGVYWEDADGKRELFFGMWAPFSQEHGFPLCFGIQNSKAVKTPELKSALDLACVDATKQCRGWTMGWITKEAIETADPLETVWAQLAPVLKNVLKE